VTKYTVWNSGQFNGLFFGLSGNHEINDDDLNPSVVSVATNTYYAALARSSLGGGRILRRTLSVRLSVCLSVRAVIERHVAPPSELQ